LTAVLDASRKKDYEDKKFAASLQGIDLEDEKEVEDISALKFSNVASKEGFGINEGLGFMVQE
jgi:hypothetical protein